MSPILTQASLWHLAIAYGVVIIPLGLLGTGVVVALHRRGGAR